MDGIDFTTALARLLSDGRLRDAFRADAPAVLDELDVQRDQRSALLQLPVDDLEFQARVLLHKRYEQVLHWLPETCRRLAEQAWPQFAEYARNHLPHGVRIDAIGFAEQVRDFCSRSEITRLRFATSKRWLCVSDVPDLPVRGCPHRALQVLVRRRDGWREFAIYFSL